MTNSNQDPQTPLERVLDINPNGDDSHNPARTVSAFVGAILSFGLAVGILDIPDSGMTITDINPSNFQTVGVGSGGAFDMNEMLHSLGSPNAELTAQAPTFAQAPTYKVVTSGPNGP
jgi:hypothetical protein